MSDPLPLCLAGAPSPKGAQAVRQASSEGVLASNSLRHLVHAGTEIADRYMADADAHRWTARHGIILDRAGTRPFTGCDGGAWVLRRTHPIYSSPSPAR